MTQDNTDDRIKSSPSKRDIFIGAYNDIHEGLKRRGGLVGQESFAASLTAAIARERWLARFRGQLEVLREARNCMEHTALEGLPVMEPTEWAVSAIQALRSTVLCPESIARFTHGVECGDAFTTVSEIIQIMYKKSYSQIPIKCVDGRYRLLTSNTVTRWVADSMGRGLNFDTCVGDILKFSEGIEAVVFLGRRANLYQVLAEFEAHPGLTAVLITEHGRDTETPLGIVTVSDVLDYKRQKDGMFTE